MKIFKKGRKERESEGSNTRQEMQSQKIKINI